MFTHARLSYQADDMLVTKLPARRRAQSPARRRAQLPARRRAHHQLIVELIITQSARCRGHHQLVVELLG